MDIRYNPFWGEAEHLKEMSATEIAYHEGYDDGYAEGSEYRERLEVLEQRCEQLEGLLSANVRVIKAEIKKELEEQRLAGVTS